MKDHEKFYDLERKIRSLPEPDYDKKFTKDTQEIIHEHLLQIASSYEKRKKRRAAIMKRISVSIASVAALVLVAILTIPIIKDRPSSSGSIKNGQQSEEQTTIDGNKTGNNNNKDANEPKNNKDAIDQNEPKNNKDAIDQNQPENNVTDTIVYNNTKYGFTFTLPKSWDGYQIVMDSWEGLSVDQQQIIEKGPILLIRHPEWTEEKPRQDIPIMIFTHDQWSLLAKEEYHIGAAPIGPTMLGQNNEYVFALPARYNFAFPEGYEEVEKILENNPLQPENVKLDTSKN